jgi:hypothetical protein
VAYFCSFVTCMFCSCCIVYFGLVFEPAVARAWLLSSLFSLVLEFFLTDPAKIAVLGVVKTRIEMEIGAYRDKKMEMVNVRMKKRLPTIPLRSKYLQIPSDSTH